MIRIKILFKIHTHTNKSFNHEKKNKKTISNQIIINKKFDKNTVNIDDDNNDKDENKPSFDRRCILFVFSSDVERNASKGLRVFSSKKKKKKQRK